MKPVKKVTTRKKNNKPTKPKTISAEPYQTVFGGKDRKLWLLLPIALLLIGSLYVAIRYSINVGIIPVYGVTSYFLIEPNVSASLIAIFASFYLYKVIFGKPVSKVATVVACLYSFLVLYVVFQYLISSRVTMDDLTFTLIIIFYAPFTMVAMPILSITGIIALLFNSKNKT